MSNLKDTDIDDLFRRASDKYPLRTDSSDWDRMAAALEKDPPPPADGTDTTDRRKKRRFFWLFFLLPLGAGGLGYYTWHTTAKAKIVTTSTNASVAGNAPATADALVTPAATDAATTTNTPTATTAAGATAPTATTPTTTAAKAPTITAANTNGTGGGINSDASDATTVNTAGSRTGSAATRTKAGKHRPNTNRLSSTGQQSDGNDAFAAANTNMPASKNSSNTSNNPFSTSIAYSHQDRLFYDLQRAPVDRNYQLNVNVVAPAAKKDSTTTKQKTSPKAKTSYLYAGILVAPDLSTVKMQAIKGVGNTFGALIGFAFNSHWAIETGAYVERKKYYTEGEYFNTKEIPTTYDTLNTVNGTCYMWEIPLNVRYTFNPEGKTKWFATAGFSTYLMTSENYNYVYEKSGNGASWPENGSKKIDTPSQYPFSIVNLSAGFEQRLGKIGNLRIEPYLRIPLTGMGTGKLPIMSTGINIGITRQLWKK